AISGSGEGYGSAGDPDSGGDSSGGGGGGRGPGATWDATGVRGITDLCADEWIPEEVVSRHREPSEQRRAAGGNRDAGGGPTTAAGESGPKYGTGQRTSFADHSGAVHGAAENGRGRQAGSG